MKYAIATPIVYQTIPAQASAAGLVNALQAAFVAAGWTSTAITGGFQLATASPQGYVAKVKIWDTGDQVGVQMVGATVNGFIHKISWGPRFADNIPPYGYQILVSPAGFFVSRPGVASDPGGSAVSGGIPYVAANCGVGGAPPTEIWYSFGDFGNSPFFANMNPRLGIDIGGGGGFLFAGVNEGCRNGLLYTFTDWSGPQILRISTEQQGFGSAVLWADGTDLLYEPLIAWASTDGGDLQIRGQVYNAAVRSRTASMESLLTFDGYDWINYTDNYQDASLWLMKRTAPTVAIANYAY